MEVILKNIGMMEEARVEIKGITVIAGENNTGKSTIGKALYAFFNAFHDIDRQIENVRLDSIQRVFAGADSLFIYFRLMRLNQGIGTIKELVKKSNDDKNDLEMTVSVFLEDLLKESDSTVSETDLIVIKE